MTLEEAVHGTTTELKYRLGLLVSPVMAKVLKKVQVKRLAQNVMVKAKWQYSMDFYPLHNLALLARVRVK